MGDITITHSRSAGYFLSALLGIFSAWLVTATVDAVKQTIAIHQPYRGQAVVSQGEP